MKPIAMIIVASSLAMGCAARLPAYQAIAIPELQEDATGSTLTLDELVASLTAAGASNVVVARGMSADGESTVSAVTADLLDRVYLFHDGELTGSVAIPHDPGYPPYHPTVKVMVSGQSEVLVVLAEGLRVQGKRVGILAFFGPDGVQSSTTLPLGGLASRHGGMKDPYIGGTDLQTGILLSARDEQGKPWSKVYVLSVADSSLAVSSLSSAEACACPIYHKWKMGTDGRTLFGQVASP